MIEDRMFPVLENLLTLTSKRQQILAGNVANIDTPGYRAKDISFAAELDGSLDLSAKVIDVETKDKPNRRKDVVFETASFQDSLGAAMTNGVQGVQVSDVVEDQTPFDRRYEPGHPDADKDGYVSYPNVNVMAEMANLVSASKSYEANIAAIGIVKTMINRTLDLGR